jgi:hypothetical protein
MCQEMYPIYNPSIYNPPLLHCLDLNFIPSP